MNRTTRWLIGGIATALINFGAGFPAGATEPTPDPLTLVAQVFSSEDPQGSWLSLSPAEQEAFAAATTPDYATFTEIKRTRITMAAYTGCWAKVGQWTQYSSVAIALFSWWQTTQVCANGGVTTSVSVTSYGQQALGPGWHTTGPVTTGTMRTATDGRGLVRANFALGVNGWNIQEATPCGQIRLGANGTTYSSSTSCILNN